MKKMFVTLFLATLFMVGTVSAVSDLQINNVQQSNTNNLDLKQTQLKKTSFIDQLTDSLLSFSQVQNSYTPSERAEIRVIATAEKDFDSSGSVRVVNMYQCHDRGCDNPPPITSSSEDSCDVREWYPDFDDCMAHYEESSDLGLIESGESVNWGVEFDAPSKTGQYILVGYIYKNGFVTDVSKEKFVVEEQASSDGDGDGVADSVDQCPDTFGELDSGCPIEQDSDGDGINNLNDYCDDEPGPESNNGCPAPTEDDTDGDGLTNSEDRCDETVGPSSNDGCPVKDNGVPVLPVVAAVLILVLGGVYYRYG